MRIAGSLALVLSAAVAIGAEGSGYSIETFLGITYIREVSISPDGARIAFITATDDFSADRTDVAVWLVGAEEREPAPHQLTHEAGGFSRVRWSPDGRYLSFVQTRSGAAASLAIWTVPRVIPSGLGMTLEFPEGVDAYDWLPRGDALVVATKAGAERAGVARYGDVIRFAPVEPSTSIYQVTADGARQLLFSVPTRIEELRISHAGDKLAYVSAPPTEFGDSLAHWEVFEADLKSGERRQLTRNYVAESTLTWSREDRWLYVIGSGEPEATRNTESQGHLYRIDLKDSRTEDVAPHFHGSIEELALGEGDSLLATGVASTSNRLLRINASKRTHQVINSGRGAVSRLSASAEGNRVAFVLSTPDSFPEVYAGTIAAPNRITSLNGRLSAMPKPMVETIRWPNGEGDLIEGVLYWPPGRQGAKRLPFIVSIHGGPTAADLEVLAGSANNYPALLASRGYLVLRPNYRGSIGRGDEFTRKISGSFCSRPVADILTGVDFVVGQGWADPGRMGVMGYSYGGVLTDCVIARTTRFRAAVSGAGVWNYISRFGTSDNFITYDHLNLGKPPWEAFEQIWRESAISEADKIKTPTLILHGAADQRVSTSQSFELYRALTRLGVESELLIFPGEGHAFRKPSHKLTKVRAEIDWLERHLR